MGDLIEVSEFHATDHRPGKRNANWYFPDAYFDAYHSRTIKFTIASAYPASCAMHQDRLTRDGINDLAKGNLRMAIRRWIERSLEGDVIVERQNMEYWVRPPPNQYNSSPNVFLVTHGYFVFHFETDAQMLHFRLAFAEVIDEMMLTHPDKDYMSEANGFKIGRNALL